MAIRRKLYLDTNVLITAFRGQDDAASRALRLLDDASVDFVVSDYLRLETLPKPSFLGRREEVEFMQAFFAAAQVDVASDTQITRSAIDFASRYDLQAMDALHVVAATHARADAFITTEKTTKPLFRVTEVAVKSLLDA